MNNSWLERALARVEGLEEQVKTGEFRLLYQKSKVKARDEYIDLLEGFIRAQATDSAAFIVSQGLKSKRIKAREEL